MKKEILFLLLLIPTLIFGQNKAAETIELTNISFTAPFNLTDSLTHSLKIKDADNKIVLSEGVASSADKEITIHESGLYSIFIDGKLVRTVRVLPGWISILPPLLAIFLSLIFREVLISLFAGIYLGAIFLYDYHLFAAFMRVVDTILINVLVNRDHVIIIIFTLLIGGVVGIISANGGTMGLADKIVKWAKTPRSGMIVSWLMGVIIFFDDYSNSLIVGNMMRPITDKLRISREKLAYIVDSTAAPVASLVVISTWIGYELGLIGDGLKIVGVNLTAYDVFLQSLLYRFYPIAALVFVFLNAYTERDFGPMLKAEKRARKEGVKNEAFDVGNNIIGIETFEHDKPRWYNAIVPILVILLGTMIGLYISGKNALQSEGIKLYDLQDVISNSNSYYALLWGSFAAVVTALIMTVVQKLRKLSDTMNAFMKGMQSLLVAVVILVFAWGISTITAELHTADYLISVIVGNIDIRFLSSLVFIVCAITSFSTGTSWGTMAIVMPIVIPLTYKMGGIAGLTPEMINVTLYSVVGSVLAGSVFGDHCSPIADTTILSSLASGCNHIEHVRTQLPYAIFVGILSVLFGTLLTSFGVSAWFSYLIIISAMFAVLYLKGEKVLKTLDKS